jgi:hypothetical protein
MTGNMEYIYDMEEVIDKLNMDSSSEKQDLFSLSYINRRAVRNVHPPQNGCIFMPKASRKYSLNEIVHEVNATLEELANPRASARNFLGAAIDTGAERSVIGWKQATMYCLLSSSEMELLPSNRLFKFGDQTSAAWGR